MGNSSAKPSPEIEEAERQLGSQAAAVRRDFEQVAQGQQATTVEQMAGFLEIDAAFAKALFETDTKVSYGMFVSCAQQLSVGSTTSRATLYQRALPQRAQARRVVLLALDKTTGPHKDRFSSSHGNETLLALLDDSMEKKGSFSRVCQEHKVFCQLLDAYCSKLRYTAHPGPSLVPRTCEPSHMLGAADALFLARLLPEAQQEEWRRTFMLSADGQSFATFSNAILNRGPTLLLFQDDAGHRFGAYASQAWEQKGHFYGDERSFVFSLAPELRVFHATGANDNFQYYNTGTQTLPNGVGMGGQINFFALFVESNLTHGHCKGSPSTTYANPRLSKHEAFKLVDAEAWALGPPADMGGVSAGGPSILQGRATEEALMEMAGVSLHSKHIREPHPDDA